MKWWFKKPKKLNETTRLYALYGESANVEYLDSVDKETTARVDNLSTQLEETKTNLQNLEKKVDSKVNARKMTTFKEKRVDTTWDKIEIKPGMYLFKLNRIFNHIIVIKTNFLDRFTYYYKCYIDTLTINGKEKKVRIPISEGRIENIYGGLTIDVAFENSKTDSAIQFISDITDNDWNRATILVELYPYEYLPSSYAFEEDYNGRKEKCFKRF